MTRLKEWLICRVLPIWAREELLSQIRQLEEENRRLREEVNRQRAYIAGLETGIRNQRKVVIVNGGKKPSPGGWCAAQRIKNSHDCRWQSYHNSIGGCP